MLKVLSEVCVPSALCIEIVIYAGGNGGLVGAMNFAASLLEDGDMTRNAVLTSIYCRLSASLWGYRRLDSQLR